MYILLLLYYFIICKTEYINNKPNILIIIADDLGWADVQYHNSSILTPNINHISSQGIRLNNYYVHPTCTPSRASLFTGKFASNTGLNYALLGHSPYGITSKHIMFIRIKGNY